MRNMNIAVDFDGTCVTHEYPEVGKDIGAVPILKKLVNNGHKLILFTMRSGEELQDAVEWFQENEIPLYGVNENPSQKEWTDSPKVYANLYIDDAGINTPLKFEPSISLRPFVDWTIVDRILTPLY
jgi:hypothetical protein